MTTNTIDNTAVTPSARATVVSAVDRLCKAMLAGDGATLQKLVEEDLSYGHSSGTLQNRAAFIESLDGMNSFKSLVLSQQTVNIVGDNAVVRHVFDSENYLPGGGTSSSHIGVLQVWKKSSQGWRLLARQAHLLPKN